MSIVRYNLTARSNGVPTSGLSPTWNTLVQSNGGSAVTTPNTTVPITSLSGGGYQIAYDPLGTLGELYGIIDFGSSISDPNERYADISLTMSMDITQVIPMTGNTAYSVADCLGAARADGFGKWVQSGTTLTIYGSDGTTVVRTFTLDSSGAPTQRVGSPL